MPLMPCSVAYFNSPPSMTVRSTPPEAPIGWYDILVNNNVCKLFAAPGGHVFVIYGQSSQITTFVTGAARTWPTLVALRADNVSAEGIQAAIDWPPRVIDTLIVGEPDLIGEQSEGLEAPRAFNSSTWSKMNTTVLANTFLGPTFVNDAEGIVEASSTPNALYGVSQAINNTITNAAAKFCVDVKPQARGWVRLGILSSGSNSFAWFDIKNAQAGSVQNCTSSLAVLGNGFVRCQMNYTHDGAMTAEVIGTTGDLVGNITGVANQLAFTASYASVIQ
jgi:hypothetical protein